jgi:hypothetical protein
MPWPGNLTDNYQSSYFGVWTVTATVQLADQIINDTMQFEYDYLVHIWSVTTDMTQYNHGDTVAITFNYGSLAEQTYPAYFVASIVDQLGVTDGIATLSTTVGGATFGVYTNSTATLTITLPSWAYAGIATVHVDGFNAEPTEGGAAITPEYVGPSFIILPQ